MPVSSRIRSRGDALVQRGFRGHCALVAIAERIANRRAALIEPHIIHRPSIDSDRTDALVRDLRTLLQPLLQPTEDQLACPSAAVRALHRMVRKAMHQLDVRLTALPAQQRHTAALRAQIDRHQRAPCPAAAAPQMPRRAHRR